MFGRNATAIMSAVLALGCVLATNADAQPQITPESGGGTSHALVAPDSDAANGGDHSPEVTLPVPPLDLTMTAELGGAFYNDGAAPSGVLFGGTALMRMGIVGVGLSAVANGALFFSPSRSSDYSLLVGFSSRNSKGLRLDLLGSLGWRSYTGWGGSGLGSDATFKGASASVPCAGARLRLVYLFSRHRRVHFLLGGQLSWDHDLEKRQAASYDNGWGEVRTVGGHRTMVGLVIGAAFDIGPAHTARHPSH
jgi:hypothetical protein